MLKPELQPKRRSRPLRVESNDVLWFVAARVIEGRFVLHPILANGLQPPNHKARRVLRAIQRHYDKRFVGLVKRANAQLGPYQAPLTVEDAKRLACGGATGRVGYSLDNPRKANLVENFEQWPGLNLAYGIGDDDALTFEYLDRTAWHRARRPQSLSPFFKTATLKLSPLPSCEGMSREAYRDAVLSWVRDAQAKANARLEGTRRPPVAGIEKIVHADFDTRPRHPASRRRPYAFGEPEARAAHRNGMIALMQGYQLCSERYRNGERMVPFPEGVYLPPVMQAA